MSRDSYRHGDDKTFAIIWHPLFKIAKSQKKLMCNETQSIELIEMELISSGN